MPDDPNNPNPQPAPSPAPQPAPQPAPAPAPAPSPAPNPATEELLKAERAKNAALQAERDAEKVRADSLQSKVEATERQKLEEDGNYKALAERAQEDATRARADAEAAQSRANDILINSELRIALIRQGVLDPDVASLVDRSTVRVEAGQVVGLDNVVQSFKTTKPHLFGEAPKIPASTAAGGPQPVPTGDPAPIADVSKMSREEYEAHKRKTLRGLRTASRR